MLIKHNISTTRLEKLTTDVEQKTSFTLDRCELNIFETHRRVENVRLTFDGFTVTSMLKGKKVLHETSTGHVKNYLPGESYIMRPDNEMVIDFPEAHYHNPTQCTALVIDTDYLNKQLDYINETSPRFGETNGTWNIDFNTLWLRNDEQVANLTGRLIRIFTGSDPMKDILVDLKLKELVLSIMRHQNLQSISQNSETEPANERFRAVVEYIRRNITSNFQSGELSKMACMSKSVFYRTFTNEFGMPPSKMVLIEKIKRAKTMMATENMKIKEVCFALGFSDPNYFSRAFKKLEGISPLQYLESIRGKDTDFRIS